MSRYFSLRPAAEPGPSSTSSGAGGSSHGLSVPISSGASPNRSSSDGACRRMIEVNGGKGIAPARAKFQFTTRSLGFSNQFSMDSVEFSSNPHSPKTGWKKGTGDGHTGPNF